MPRELEVPVPPDGEDAADYFDAMFDQAERDRIRHARLDAGVYRFRRPARVCHYGLSIWGEGKAWTQLVKDFSSSDEVGVLNQRTGGFTWADFQVVSERGSQVDGKGTGRLLSVAVDEHSPGGTVGHIFIKRLDLTCASGALPWPHPAYHKYGLVMDGSLGGKADRPLIRTAAITDCSIFGHELGGAALLLRSASGVGVERSYATWAGGKASTVRIDGVPTAHSLNNTIRLHACMQIELDNANDITIETNLVEFDVIAGSNVEHITGSGHVKRKLIGDWNKPQSTLKWN